ncbi:mannitol dehydrogenase family protein [Nonomuraea sp. NPDC046802]|uniref:mannitol dehydrogenase family protein n=1 Tax=Nonomuraea sp. NPDC046802 TaxID=3154919 RepID=UPI0033CEF716
MSDRYVVHLGLGAFARSHTAWYTRHTGWRMIGFTGRRPGVARLLDKHRGVYHVLTRHPDRDEAERVEVLSRVHDGADLPAWLEACASPSTHVVTVTVTEKGYRLTPSGSLDLDDADVRADIELLRAAPFGSPARTAPGRLAQGLLARADRAPDAPVAVVGCDNLRGNGRLAERAVLGILEAVPGRSEWVRGNVGFVSSMVDRITPAATPEDLAQVRALTGVDDPAAVVAEPFAEWVLDDAFPAQRPRWEVAGAVLTSQVAGHELRKLLVLNGAHTLLAHTGLLKDVRTVAGAIARPELLELVTAWWQAVRPLLPFPAPEVDAYERAVLERFRNARIEHRLTQIATDATEKLRVRVLPLLNGSAAQQVAVEQLAAWIACRRAGVAPDDPLGPRLARAARGTPQEAAARMLALLDPALADDHDLRTRVGNRLRDL